MDIINLLVFLVIGLALGLLAGLILKGTGLGLACDVGVGVAGGADWWSSDGFSW